MIKMSLTEPWEGKWFTGPLATLGNVRVRTFRLVLLTVSSPELQKPSQWLGFSFAELLIQSPVAVLVQLTLWSGSQRNSPDRLPTGSSRRLLDLQASRLRGPPLNEAVHQYDKHSWHNEAGGREVEGVTVVLHRVHQPAWHADTRTVKTTNNKICQQQGVSLKTADL